MFPEAMHDFPPTTDRLFERGRLFEPGHSFFRSPSRLAVYLSRAIYLSKGRKYGMHLQINCTVFHFSAFLVIEMSSSQFIEFLGRSSE